MATRRTFRGNADPISKLIDILVGTPEEFNADWDKLRGRVASSGLASGRLNGADYDTFMANRAQGRITYVIYSYNTPIAWRVYDRADPIASDHQSWVMPTTSGGTVTTAKHINKVATALRQISGGIK